MSEVKIDVQTRRAEEQNNELRRVGVIPAVLYGYKVANQNLKLKRNEFDKIYSQVGESGLVELNIDGKSKILVIIKEVQKDYVKNICLHVDFYKVDMKKIIEVELPLNFINETEVVKTKGGILAINLDFIRVKCLPGDLIKMIDVDLSTLKSFSDKIKVSDLVVPANIIITSQSSTLIANVLEPKIIKKEETDDSTKEKIGEEDDKTTEGDKKEGKSEEETTK